MPEQIITLHAEVRERLDKYVALQVPALSRTAAQRLIVDGLITVGGESVTVAHRLRQGDEIVVRIPEVEAAVLEAESIPLSIVYEDDDVIVIDKPAGLVVHPAVGHDHGTLVNALLAYAPQIRDAGEAQRPGIVHRLDKDTSGLIVVAKHDLAHHELQRQFKSRLVEKQYIALAEGHITTDEMIVDAPIGRDTAHRKRMAVVGNGRAARTRFVVTTRLRDAEHQAFTLLDAHPRTGRTHQIRVHLASIQHPLVGDKVYGRKKPSLSIMRHFLHAAGLAFDLPSSGERRTFSSSLPQELADIIDLLQPD